MKILLVEDDETLCQQIIDALVQWDFEVIPATDFSHVLQTYIQVAPQIVIMDVTLPKYDGFYWTRQIRSQSNVPIVFLSSRDNPMDQVMSMELGADDYMQKPFHMPVLIAKLQAIYRRVYQYNQETKRTLMWQGCVVDLTRDCIERNDQCITLSKTEMLILDVLLAKKNQIVSRDELMTALWDDESFVSDNTLTVNINRLRKKLRIFDMQQAIETKVGKGYMAHETL
ncbi:response regulator transcription factor [Staphylococcus sp. IVB6246]|uniref:response regulator transcription factor n=1 Tax=unclassified Staphylococcus TaxID=91994 RepID=UPI0021D1C959|nr:MULTISPECIES: response regulator transcription factor [unclassified Staphylococcus]UXR69913.1 response regulator transcription factor [Staphylococcus sp. IVB6246]UXR71952.1 response regulator transcription factor [Staphylococcus sp. IVB6240]UXR74260.1 response regulator transcription factor [Staphylococcus sp. IVB6238]